MFYSDAKQDQFVANLLNFKNDGYYLDIGSCHSIGSNNSYVFDNEFNWTGICVELQESYKSSYDGRKQCTFLNEDATKLNYKEVLQKNKFPKIIDYLSLDVDTASLEVLEKLPLDEFKFKVITIEHDFYIYGDTYRGKQREILEKNNYILLCADVYVQQNGFDKKECSFEDWWVHPDFFDINTIEKIKSYELYPSEILSKF